MTIPFKVLCLFSLVILGFVSSAHAQEKGDPLTGVWKGDCGPSKTDRNAVVLDLQWNGRTLRGTVNPGPEAFSIGTASFDRSTMKIHLEVTKTSPNFIYAVDGVIVGNNMTGTWNRPGRQGDFQLTRDVKAKKAELDNDSAGPILTGLRPDEKR